MKLTWTKKNPKSSEKKRIRNPIFDDQIQSHIVTKSGGREEEVSDGSGESDEFQKLSDEFQAQGNKLAEVWIVTVVSLLLFVLLEILFD